MAPVKVDRSNLQIPGIVIFPFALQAWRYRNTISLTERKGISKTSFPVLIDIQGNDPSGANYVDFSLVKSGGDDNRFTRSDGETLLTYWIESWDAAGKIAHIWVKMDSLPAQGTIPVFLYYHNGMALQASDLSGTLYGQESWNIITKFIFSLSCALFSFPFSAQHLLAFQLNPQNRLQVQPLVLLFS